MGIVLYVDLLGQEVLMCRYAMIKYKPNFACFSCRKSFGRGLTHRKVAITWRILEHFDHYLSEIHFPLSNFSHLDIIQPSWSEIRQIDHLGLS